MNTLPKSITATFFKTAEDYTTLKAHWSKLVNSPRKKELGPEHHLLYSALLGRDWRKGFTPITNKNKLANGMRPLMGVEKALGGIDWPLKLSTPKYFDLLVAPFDGLVTREMVVEVDKLLPHFNYHLSASFEAYNVPVAADAAA
jgi:hypothetical protein